VRTPSFERVRDEHDSIADFDTEHFAARGSIRGELDPQVLQQCSFTCAT
jgi:hypothetical protein